jgi:tRNA modification GTPase
MTRSPDTIAAIATPPGRGGVGVIRVSGATVPAVIAGLVGHELPPRVATLTTFRGARGEALDQGLALHFPAPRSYTGEHVLEVHGHGGPAVLRLLLARCLELGARLAEPGEFTKRAFLNGKLDLAQAEGVADLIDAATATAARAAARSLSGAFSREIHALVNALTELRMFTEATLDFPDEDIDFLRAADAQGKLSAIRGQLAQVLVRARQGALLRDGLTVVLIGAPNVGKSSLMNRLAGDEVAIVTPVPGTTRDTVLSAIEIRGIPLTVIDTAGLRPTDDPVETWASSARGRRCGAPTSRWCWSTRRRAKRNSTIPMRPSSGAPAALPRIVIHNKIDLAGIAPGRNRGRRQGDGRGMFLSAKTGAGVDLLQHEMLSSRARTRTWKARFSRASGISPPCARPRPGSPPPRSTSPPRVRLGLFAEAPGRAGSAVGDHRRVHRRRSARRHFFPVLPRQVIVARARRWLRGRGARRPCARRLVVRLLHMPIRGCWAR